MVRRKKQKYILSVFLLFFIAALAVPALGEEISVVNKSKDKYPPEFFLNQSVLYERGSDWDDYLNSDGSHTRKIYSGLMNYWNGTGYEPIDTTIVEAEGAFRVEKGAYKVQWSNNGKTFKFKKDNYYFIYQGKEISQRKSKRVLGAIREVKGQKNKNKVEFKEIYPNVDVEYVYYPDLLKENIILNRAPDISADPNDTLDFSGDIDYSKDLEIWVNGTKQGDTFSTSQAIEFRAGDKIEFILPPPVIEDANNSQVIGEYELVRKSGRTQLSIKVPYEWLINSSRVYPVIVDPNIKINTQGDAFVYQFFPYWNFGSWSDLFINTLAGYTQRIYLKFDLSSIPPGSTINYADLNLYRYSGYDSRRIDSHFVSYDGWSESGITWWNKPDYSSNYLDYEYSHNGWNIWYVTGHVRNEFGGDKKISLMLKDRYDGSLSAYRQLYYSKESGYAPFLYVDYTPATTQNDCGTGGDASNTFSGANYIPTPNTCSGYLDSSDRNDYYKFYVTSGYTIDATMTPPSGANFNLYLYDPNGNLKKYSILGPGYTDAVSFVADSSGYWRVEIYQYSGSGTYSLNVNAADKTPPPAPVISSPTHPDQNAWYSNKNPSFSWTTPSDASGIIGYSYALDKSSSTTPDETVDTTGNSVSYSNIADGTWYFHVRAKDNAGNWGSAAHYKINIDVTPPSVSISSPASNSVLTSSTVEVRWSASDSGSGINRYEVQLDSGGWINKGLQTSHTFYGVSPGTHTVYVKAIDNAANSATASVTFTVQQLLPDLSISPEDIFFEKIGGS